MRGGFRTKRECEAALGEVLSALRSGAFVEASRRTVRSFLLDEWLPVVQPALRATTWSTYRTHMESYVIPILGDVELQRLTPAQLGGLYRKLLKDGRRRRKGGLSPKSVQNTHRALHRALRDAVRWGYVVRNVADAVDPPKSKQAEMKFWTPSDLRTFLASVETDRLYAAWVLTATTGMRRGELAGLRWVDMDFPAGRVHIRKPRVMADGEVVISEPKTKRGRRGIALDHRTLGALRAWQERQSQERELVGKGYVDSGMVFTQPDGSAIKPYLFTDWFEAHVKRAGLPRIRLHDMRHSYASAALAAGVPAKVVSERLGHANIGITMDTYSHVVPALDQDAADTVAELIFGGQEDSPDDRP
jgi:integrase